MKKTISQIESALKKIYNLESTHQAKDFIVTEHPNPSLPGALLIQETEELSLGIFFNQTLRENLTLTGQLPHRPWTHEELKLFTIAIEEVSHFHYLVHHVGQGRSVTQLELELQGEIDKFFVAYYSQKLTNDQAIENLFESLFIKFSLPKTLSQEQQTRYKAANTFAKNFITKQMKTLKNSPNPKKIIQSLRKFYRMTFPDKISYLNK